MCFLREFHKSFRYVDITSIEINMNIDHGGRKSGNMLKLQKDEITEA